jgi:hypothetical protein
MNYYSKPNIISVFAICFNKYRLFKSALTETGIDY